MKKDIMISLMLGTRSIRILNIIKEMHHIISTTTKGPCGNSCTSLNLSLDVALNPTTSCCLDVTFFIWR
jgi:hypothetical protein